jgi:hypothetical protein
VLVGGGSTGIAVAERERGDRVDAGRKVRQSTVKLMTGETSFDHGHPTHVHGMPVDELP